MLRRRIVSSNPADTVADVWQALGHVVFHSATAHCFSAIRKPSHPCAAPNTHFLPADALADIAAGKFVVVTDDADRENEGDLIMAADRMTEEAMAFMVSAN